MAIEIERQYVVNTDHVEWQKIQSTLPSKRYIQATIHRGDDNKLRVRLIEDLVTWEKSACFTFKVEKKSKKDEPNIRDEYEWDVPYRAALYIMIGHPEVHKIRKSYIHTDGKTWEIDEYQWANAWLVIADIELKHADEKFDIPVWIWQESTKDRRITNNSFSLHPYANWTPEEKSWIEKLKKRK